jgi:hypothetical protein
MRKTLLTLAVLSGVVAVGGAVQAKPLVHKTAAQVHKVQYYDPDWREHEYWRHRRQEEWRRREAWRDREEHRDRYLGGPPAVVVTPPGIAYGRGW